MKQGRRRWTRHRPLQAQRQQRLEFARPPAPDGTGHARYIRDLDGRIQVDLDGTVSHAGFRLCCGSMLPVSAAK
ncbi:MAG: hypothetical protein ACK58T_18930 [Phycisphaerae bacterium]